MQLQRNAEALEHAAEQDAVIEADHEVGEAERAQHVAHRRAHLNFDDRRARADRVDVALIELTESAARRAVGAPHRLNLIALEEARQLAAVLGHDARERHRQVVAQGQVCFAGRLVLTSPQDLENQLRAFLAILPRQGLDVLERRRLERLEPISPINGLDDIDDVVAASHILGEKVTHAARGARLLWHKVSGARRNRGTEGPDRRTDIWTL